MKNSLKETILNYCEIINEDTHSSYAKKLFDEVVSKNLNQSNLDNVSFISFNRKRIEQAKKTNDHILNYKNAAEFSEKVINWFISNHHFREQDRNFLTRAATDYFNNFA